MKPTKACVKLTSEQMSLEDYETSIKFFSQFALSDEARLAVSQG